MAAGASLHLLLQFANAVWFHVAWPHVVAVLWSLTLAFVMFVRLLRSAWSD